MIFNKVNLVLEELRTFTTLEIAELILQLEQLFISSQMTENTIAETVVETPTTEKTSVNVNVIIKSVPLDKKITLLKAVRTITGLGLKESKAIVDSLPQTIKADILKDEALQIQKDLETTGAEVIIEPTQIKN